MRKSIPQGGFMRRNNNNSAETSSTTGLTKTLIENQKEFTLLKKIYDNIIASISLSIQKKQFDLTDSVVSTLEDIQRRLSIVEKSLSAHGDPVKNKNDLAKARQGLVNFVDQYTHQNNDLHQFIDSLYPTPPTKPIATKNLWRGELTALQKQLVTYEANYQASKDLDLKNEMLPKMLQLIQNKLSPATKGFEQERNNAINQVRSSWDKRVTAHYMTLAKEKIAFVQKGLSHLEDKRFPNSYGAIESHIKKMTDYLNDAYRWLLFPAVAKNKLSDQEMKIFKNFKSLSDRIDNLNKDVDLQRLEASMSARKR
jgi:hypothetical protein